LILSLKINSKETFDPKLKMDQKNILQISWRRRKGRKERSEANCFLTRINNTNSFSPYYFSKEKPWHSK